VVQPQRGSPRVTVRSLPAVASAGAAAVAEIEDASLPLQQLEQQLEVPIGSQLEQLKQKLEQELARPASPGATGITTTSSGSLRRSIHQWGDGSGLTVEQFTAALQSLPMQRRMRWKSMYPAIGTGSRGQVFHAINLDTGALLHLQCSTTSYALQ
jgi:hypothetical protein